MQPFNRHRLRRGPVRVHPRRPSPPPYKPLDNGSPIHESQITPNPQPNSPLFSGLIPAEIRNAIFTYALNETPKSETYPDSLSRPNHTHKQIIHTALLQTCRLIYLETHTLPITLRHHRFYHGPAQGPYGSQFPDRDSLEQEDWYFSLMTTWQLSMVKEVELYTQMFWLQDSFKNLCRQPYMSQIEKLKITIRRGDWWYNERNEVLYILPMRRTNSIEEMRAIMKSTFENHNVGRGVAWSDDAWGSALKELLNLKVLEMEFEITLADKGQELEDIVTWAKTWRFPMRDGHVLSAEGIEPKKNVWEGNITHWSNQCPFCGSQNQRILNSVHAPGTQVIAQAPSRPNVRRAGNCRGWETGRESVMCKLRAKKMEEGEGPELVVWNMRWRLKEEKVDVRE